MCVDVGTRVERQHDPAGERKASDLCEHLVKVSVLDPHTLRPLGVADRPERAGRLALSVVVPRPDQGRKGRNPPGPFVQVEGTSPLGLTAIPILVGRGGRERAWEFSLSPR